MLKTPKILVVGSFVMDLIVSTSVHPNSGETVLGNSFSTAAGGKGANQAVQAARMGARVAMFGKVGDDGFGYELIQSAKNSNIDVSEVIVEKNVSSAVGNIILETKEGEKSKNRIIVVPGANMTIRPADIQFLESEIKQYDMVLLQLEIPLEINEIVAEIAYKNNVEVMLNSAPAAPLSDKLVSYLTYISPNEHEASMLTGVKINIDDKGVNIKDVKKAIQCLLNKGVKNVIITLGSNGVAFGNKDEFIVKPCIDIVDVVDPTSAGDSFVGSFCTGICAGLSHEQALDLANYTATLTVSKLGAQPSLPTINEVYSLMKKDNYTNFDIEVLKDLVKEQ